MGRTLVLALLAAASFAVVAAVFYVAGAALGLAFLASGALAGAGLLAYALLKATLSRSAAGPPASAS